MILEIFNQGRGGVGGPVAPTFEDTHPNKITVTETIQHGLLMMKEGKPESFHRHPGSS